MHLQSLSSLLWMPLAALVKYQWRWLVQIHRCHIWEVTFISDLGTLPLLVADDLDLTGTGINVCDQSYCWHSTSIWWAWLWINCRSRHTRSIHLDTRIEAGHSILRTHLCFKCNGIQSIRHTLPAISNTVPTPTCTSIGSELLSI